MILLYSNVEKCYSNSCLFYPISKKKREKNICFQKIKFECLLQGFFPVTFNKNL